MSGDGPKSAKVAETLTLNDCISAADFALSESGAAVQTAVANAAEGIPAAALATSDADWRKAFEAVLGIQVGRMFKAACLRFAIDVPAVETEANGEATVALLPFVV